MSCGLLRALHSANVQISSQINRHAWVGWAFVYVTQIIFFTAYRTSNVDKLAKTSTTPDEDTTAARACGVLLGIIQDFIVISFLVLLLWGFDAAVNHSSFCNDTAPNGCLDCFTRGVPLLARIKLVLKRILRFSCIFTSCILSVAVFSIDVVVVRVYRQRYEFGWDSSSRGRAVPVAEENKTIHHTLAIALAVQGFIAIVATIWLDFTRWTPLAFVNQWSIFDRRTLTTATSRPSANYLGMDSEENLSEFTDSSNRPINGTQPPPPEAILSDDRRDLPVPKWKFALFGLGLAIVIFVFVPLLVLLITSYCSPTISSIALNVNLNEPIRAITTLSLVPSL